MRKSQRLGIHLLVSTMAAFLVTGCLLWTVREQRRKVEQLSELQGTVITELAADHPIVVVLLRRGTEWEIVDHFTREKPGRWYFRVTPGMYALAAFVDVSSDLVYQPSEPALPPGPGTSYTLQPGESKTGIELLITAKGRGRAERPIDIPALVARAPYDQENATLGQLSVAGKVVPMEDPRFDRKNGSLGLRKPWDFAFDIRPGIYFLQEYEEGKTPVLFVHGIGGTPRDFEVLISRLDRTRFQPWVYFYPSGSPLLRVSQLLKQTIIGLRIRYQFDGFHVVAHSMGGLVARSFILEHSKATRRDDVRLFVSISTPWGGHKGARIGAKRSPEPIPSWKDVAEGSDFVEGLFFLDPDTRTTRRRLPEHIAFFLLFGHNRNTKLPGPSGDRVLTMSSMLRQEAQDDAAYTRGFDSDHSEILRDAAVASLVNRILADNLR
jgi:pimeloyl-ACP methyl ester carboxylesterase